MLLLTAIGRNLPVEAKRHYHPELWTAAATQLQGYTAEAGAEGRGIYVVFWFGVEVEPTPGRPGGSARPTTAENLEAMLIRDLSPELRARTGVIVFDVSDPKAGMKARLRKKPRSQKVVAQP
jgi:hypothetical protein